MAIYFEEKRKGLAIFSEDSDLPFAYARNGKLFITSLQHGRHNTLEATPEELDLIKRLVEYTATRDK